MARRTNIVDFDQARAASSSRRAQAPAGKGGRRASDGRSASESDGRAQSSRKGTSSSRRNSKAAGSRAKGEAQAAKRDDGRRDRAASANTRANQQSKARGAKAEGAREQRRRSRNKARADKLFEAQFSASSTSRQEGEGEAPRAAVYEGQVGSSQRKAARMQRSSETGPVTAKINPAGWFSNLNLSPRSVKVVTAVLCVVLTGAFLYVPAQQYYKSVREHDRLEAEYAVIAERNAVLDEQNDMLAGDAGMEDAVRQKYGYVKQGDQTAIVTGLSSRTTDTSRDGETIEANVLSSTVKAPEEWYTPYLDAFFGVS